VSIRRGNVRVYTLVCDTCGATQAFRCDTSWEALQLAKGRGWHGGSKDTCRRCPAPTVKKTPARKPRVR
jgi:hypothetical protein